MRFVSQNQLASEDGDRCVLSDDEVFGVGCVESLFVLFERRRRRWRGGKRMSEGEKESGRSKVETKRTGIKMSRSLGRCSAMMREGKSMKQRPRARRAKACPLAGSAAVWRKVRSVAPTDKRTVKASWPEFARRVTKTAYEATFRGRSWKDARKEERERKAMGSATRGRRMECKKEEHTERVPTDRSFQSMRQIWSTW